VRFFLNDFDKVEDTNLETGVLFEPGDEGVLKTRVLDGWLKAIGSHTRLLEQQFDEHFRKQDARPGKFEGEPALAFCGFDSNAARSHIETAGFGQVVESGLGGKTGNFDTISLHTYPNARPAIELWPDIDPEEVKREIELQEKMARKTTAIRICRRMNADGRSLPVNPSPYRSSA
jgi:hypothetical protein